MERQKRVAAVHDISGFGKCSLTVALPVISAAGIEVSVLPTAVLSAHTAVPGNIFCRDLTDDMEHFISHWDELGLHFDAIYTGYLGSAKQAEIVCDFIDRFRQPDTLVIVDPAMADNGRMYSLFDMNFARSMLPLCQKADIIVPNITEALFLLEREYVSGPHSRDFTDELVDSLQSLCGCDVVLTGISCDENTMAVACRTQKAGQTEYINNRRIPGTFHGTGDVFASALTAARLSGRTLKESAEIAVQLTVGSIKRTAAGGTDHKYGVDFERGLWQFADMLK